MTKIYKAVSSFILAACILLAIALAGCKTQTDVLTATNESIQNSNIDHNRYLRDSIFVMDSSFVLQRGDTVHLHHWHTIYKEHTAADTIRDTTTTVIQNNIPYPVEVTVEKKYIPTFYKSCTISFWVLLLIALMAVALFIFKKSRALV